MDQLRISLPRDGAETEQDVLLDLREDLEREVGPTRYADTTAQAEAKSGTAVDWAALAVNLLGTPAVVALVAVIKSYFDRQRVTEMVLETKHGKVSLKLPTGSRLSEEEIRRVVFSLTKPG